MWWEWEWEWVGEVVGGDRWLLVALGSSRGGAVAHEVHMNAMKQ